MNPEELTAASPDLPIGSKVKVRVKESGKEVVVRINDRQPPRGYPSIDLSKKAAQVLGFRKKGVADVEIEVIE